jgi:hypothetical protein
MHRGDRYFLSSLFLIAALAPPSAIRAAARPQETDVKETTVETIRTAIGSTTVRTRDYHNWHDNEERAYRGYLEENHRGYRPFAETNSKTQRAYWNWRHSHPDHDHDGR